MEIKLQKQPQKYLTSVDAPTRKKLWAALEKLKELDGDIVRLAGTQNLYRYRFPTTASYFPMRAESLSS